MNKARAFAFVALGILALVGAFALGAGSAQGQTGSIAGVSFSDPWGMVVLGNGDVYMAQLVGGGSPPTMTPWALVGNVFSGGPVPATPTTWGRIKAERR